ncbi:protein-export chaperone SecB [Yunchengibacter salinarum]|uniref:protein-export chaperone SecB n=1 Tax=Yunchengibacter salinarum TaxID=3133399 RepID=UPI0035B5E3DF
MANNDFDTQETPVNAPGAGNISGAPEGQTGEQAQPQAAMINQYVKDLSFENPNAPGSFQRQEGDKPNIDVNVNINVQRMNEEVYEVELKLSARATNKGTDGEEKVSFICELAYGALFGIRNLPDEQLRPFLMIGGPTMMFPFARRIMADATRDGGFPPLMLEPINFEALYRAQLQQQQQQQQQQQGGADGVGAPDPANLN